VSIQSTWTYTRGGGAVTVSTPAGDAIVHKFDGAGQEYETEWKSGGVTFQKLTRSWSTDGAPWVTTIERSGKKRSTSETYVEKDLTTIEQRDWGTGAPGALLSRTTYQYEPLNAYYLDENISRRIKKVELSGINPENGQFLAQGKTEFFYDEGTPIPTTSTTGSIPNKSTPLLRRGNLTTVKRYKSSSSFVTETFTYDDLGNLRTHTDPLEHTT
jgi:hypothetical protein